jgi:membrane protein
MRTPRAIAQRIDVVRSLASIIAKAGSAWLEHDASTIGAALAFYTVFSIAPILIIAIGIASMVVQGDTLRAELLSQTQNLLGPTGANAVKELLFSADYLGKSRYATRPCMELRARFSCSCCGATTRRRSSCSAQSSRDTIHWF